MAKKDRRKNEIIREERKGRKKNVIREREDKSGLKRKSSDVRGRKINQKRQ